SGDLTDCDVPLALLYWTLQGVQFLDRWSVRRRTVQPPSLTTTWSLPLSRRRRAEAEAVLLQFEEQLRAPVGSSPSGNAVAALQASSYFRYLPAAASIPTTSNGSTGLDVELFLSGLTYRAPVFIEGAKLRSIFDRSLAYAPIDLSSGELIWTY